LHGKKISETVDVGKLSLLLLKIIFDIVNRLGVLQNQNNGKDVSVVNIR